MKEMNDLISRQNAIDAALTFLVEYCGAAFDEDMQKMLCEMIDALPSAEPERKIIRCEDCIYFDPAHVEKDGLRLEYKDMPEEAYGPFGTPGCVTVKYGINVGSRCTYEQDNLVFRQRNDFCSRAEMRGE